MKKFQKLFRVVDEHEKLIFEYNNFFGSGHFLTHDILKNGPKNDRNQKVIGSKN